MIRSCTVLAFAVLACCSSNQTGRTPPPPVTDAFPLVPSIADGATLGVASVPMEFFFGSSTLEEFSLSVLGIWSGSEQVASLERDRSSSTRIYYRVSRVLEPGAYEIRVSVAGSVRPEQMALFKPVSKQVWSIRFFVGSRFCILRAGICREVGLDSMTLAIRFSTSTTQMTSEVAERVLSLEYDAEPVACSLALGTGTVAGLELNYVCALPKSKTGTAKLVLGDMLKSSAGEPLTDCGGNSAQPIEVQYDQVGCGSYSWR